MNRSGMPEELRKLLPHDIRLYVRNFWNHPNDPGRNYDFYNDDKSEFLHYLADDDGPLVPANHGDIVVLLFARGCLKTTIASAIMEWSISEYPFVEVDVTAPREDQFTEVMDRFKDHIKQSGLTQLRTKNNISHQKFERKLERDDGTTVPVEADVKARTAWNAGDALRGLHGHVGVIDEFQDVDEAMFSNFLEVVDQSVPEVDYFPTIVVIGTPKMANSFFNTLWEMSDQKTWDPDAESPDDRDRDHGAWVQQDKSEEFMPTEMRERRDELETEVAELRTYLDENDLDTDERQRIEQEIEQKQAAIDELQGYTVSGWHIDQYASPLHDDAKIEFKRNSYSKREFQNEVLAQFYTPENDLLTEDAVQGQFIEDKGFTNRRVYDDSIVTIGVDWGGGQSENSSDTVVVVGEKVPEETGDGTIYVRDIEFVDGDASMQTELDIVEQKIRDFEADRIAVDEGYGSKKREDLQNGNNIWNDSGWDNVCGVIYGNVKDKDAPKFSESGFEDSSYCTVARTHMIENMVGSFKNGNIEIHADNLTFGRGENGRKLLDQLTAPYTDRVERGGKRKKKVISDRNDDAFHALTYMWLAAEQFGSRRTLRTIGTHNRHGMR